MNGVTTNQESRKNLRTDLNHCSIFMWMSNYTNKKLHQEEVNA